MRCELCCVLCTALLLLSFAGCGGGELANTPLRSQGDGAAVNTGWPVGLPVDVQQPWERLDTNGYVIPSGRTASCINADSTLCCGVERDAASMAGVSDNGEAARLSSGEAGAGGLSWAWWRLELGGEQPGVVSADVNLLPMSDSGQSAYYIGLSNYGEGRWEWYGPLTDSHTRLSLPAGDYLSGLGNLFICVAACDGATFDVIGVAANPCDGSDSEAPAAPTGLTAAAVAGGLELGWDAVADVDLAGYRVYYSTAWFYDASATGVKVVPGLEGLTHYQLAATAETYVRVAAVDISGNESALSEIASATPLAGTAPDVRLTASQPSALIGESISLTATGADEYDWDLDGDGIFELSDDTLGTQDLNTSRAGFIRPMVRGLTEGGSCRACGGVNVLIGSNSRPLANGHADPSSGYAPLSVTFTGTGEDDDGTIEQYSWDFEDDGSYDYTHATEPDPPVHEYTTPGTYNAKFRVEDNLGLTDVDTVAVNVSDPLNVPPTADLAIGAGEERGNPPHTVNFDAGGSTDTDGSIVEYLWDFDGDGHYDYSSTVPAVVHTYTEPGAYTAVVRVEDNQGARDTATVPIGVNYAPVADLDADVTSGDPPLTVNFDAGGSSDVDGTIDDYEWDLDGDGVFNESGDEADARGSDTASHTYSESGYYTARVRVTDDEGLTDTATLVISARGWIMLTLDDTTGAGEDYMRLTVVDGNPAIGYSRYEISLQYIRSNTATGGRQEDWDASVTVAYGDLEYSSMAVVDGNPAISFLDYSGPCLKYVRSTNSTGSGWASMVTVDASSSCGWDTSLAVVAGNPAISYYDGTNEDLKYARSATATGGSDDWTQIVTVDSTGDVGSDTSLAIVDGNPAISYYDGTNDDLKYVRASTASGSAWNTPVTVDSTGNVGTYTSLAVVDGCPAISYYDDTNGDLKYVRASTASGSAWSTPVTVDSGGDVGMYLSLAIVNGNPAISYHDSTNGDLKYVRSVTATGGSGDWTQIVTVDSTGDVGSFTSLASVVGGPAIAYHDHTNHALKYAYCYQ